MVLRRAVRSGIVLALVVAFACVSAGAERETAVSPPSFTTPRPATRPAGLTVEEIIEGVAAGEKALRTVHVKGFDCTRERFDPGTKEWAEDSWRYSGSAWYEVPGDRCRIYFARNVTEWVNGRAKWAESELDVSYDGVEGRLAYVRSGPLGGPLRRDRQGQVFPGRPPLFADDRYTGFAVGKGFTLANLRIQGNPLSAYLRNVVAGGRSPEITREIVNGFETVRLFWGPGSSGGWRAVWLAPDKGFALIRHEMLVFAPDEGDTENVTRLKEVEPGVWFPTAGVADVRAGGRSRYHYRAEDVTVNDPAFDPAIFTLRFSPGYLVSNGVQGGGSFVVRGNGTTRPSVRGTAITERVGVHEVPAK